MDANRPIHSEPCLLWNECHRVVGCAFEVLNGLGHGLHEKPYENALVAEFRHRGIPLAQQARFPIIYKGVQVSEYVPT
jgi:GxxExxY protein